MSSDARIRWHLSGDLIGSHDGECCNGYVHPRVGTKYDLFVLIREIEECMGHSLAWEIRGGETGQWLAGYLAR